MKYVPGEYKVIDENTGKEFYSGDLARDWDGSLRHKDNLDGEHPDYRSKRYPMERYPRLIVEPVVDVYVTAAVDFYAGTDVPRLME
jgi:hypothetical protein